MTSPNFINHVQTVDFANRVLQDLYARRDAVDKLIRSLEQYERSAKPDRRVRRRVAR